jgi:maleylacetate reductase
MTSTTTSSATPPSGFTRQSTSRRIVFRDGALSELGAELDRLGAYRVMLLAADYDTDLGEIAGRAVGSRLTLAWDEIRQHVPEELATRATGAASGRHVDALVTVGGGSTIGLGKAIAVNTGLPLICVPTTYSGSEMTPIYGLTSDNQKTTARSERAQPSVVVYDPQLLATLPAEVVGPSAMNALAHCAEALWAANPDPITDALALDGARRLKQFLPAAYAEPDTAARGQVLLASCLAGIALGTVGTSIHHALCHLLGGMYDTPHALTHAIMLPYAVKFVRASVPDAVARLAHAMDTTVDDLPVAIWSLGRDAGTPQGLQAIGVTQAQVQHVAEVAMARGLTSPRPLNLSLLQRLLNSAWHGMLPTVF